MSAFDPLQTFGSHDLTGNRETLLPELKLIALALTLSTGACVDTFDGESCSAIQDAARFVTGWDQNRDGLLSYDEFLTSTEPNSPDQHSMEFLAETFRGYDTNGDGDISVEELQVMARHACDRAQSWGR